VSRENTYNAIILKKQPYGEGDELFTFFTEQAGKLRALGKSTKFAKSKLQHALQTCFLVRVTLTGRGLPKIIGAEAVNVFPNIRENLSAAKMAFFALEAVLKSTPDEQKNERLFHLLVMFYSFLDLCKTRFELLPLGLAKFKIQFLAHLGLAVSIPKSSSVDGGTLGFSHRQGGFVMGGNTTDILPVSPKTLAQFSALELLEFSQLISSNQTEEVLRQPLNELQELLSGFINYQMEREIKSEKLL
jgi:DNA repair protein RecO